MGNLKWKWDIDLYELIGKQVKIETQDGIYLTGALTDVKRYYFKLFGIQVGVPTLLVLDRDPEKAVDINRLVSVEPVAVPENSTEAEEPGDTTPSDTPVQDSGSDNAGVES